MKLKTLEISGFKSFARKTKMDFMPGITGVVGPNGSGKSNIIEAIRWVLGEQSAKDLRGDRMADVIFGGTSEKAPLNRAEVIITFDNSDHYLHSEYSEIQIARTLYRNGDSKYQLNGTTVRLKDIQELFMDSGLGRESFSIISQGRVEAIFSAKPENRRAIIEDVAGVYKYKQNKGRAEKELQGTRENLNRVRDILYELDSRLEPLAEQSALAQDYLNQKEQYDQLDQSRLVLELTDWYSDKEQTEHQLTQVEREQATAKGIVTEHMRKLTVARQMQEEQQAKQRTAQDELLTVSNEVQRLIGQRALQAERAANRSEAQQNLQDRLTNAQQMLAQLQADYEQQRAELANQTDQVKQSEQELATARLEHPQQRLQVLNQQFETVRNELVDAMQVLTEARNNQKLLAREHEQADATSSRLNQRQAQIEAQLATLTEQLQQAQTAADEAAATKEQLNRELAAAQAQGKQLEADHQQARQTWFGLLEQQQQQQARLESLRRVASQYDGYNQGVKHLMNVKNDFPGVQGVVAELLQVPAKYQLALETALGGALQQVVVDHEQTAQQAIKYLTQHRLGRVTFLPMTTIKPRHLNGDVLQQAQQMPGFVGVASELAQVDARYQNILANLLGVTIIVDHLENAVLMGKQLHHRVRLVTLDGQVMNAGGSMTGGAQRQQRNGFLSQQAEVETLTEQVATLATQVTEAEQKVRSLADQITPLADQFRQLQNQVLAASEKEQTTKAQLQMLEQQSAQAEREQKALAYELQQNSAQDDSQVEQSTANESVVAEQQSRVTALQEQLNVLSAEREQLGAQRDKADQVVAELQTILSQQRAQVEATKVRSEELQKQLTREQAQVEELQAQLDELTNATPATMVELETRLQDKEIQKATLEAQVNATGDELGKQTAQAETLEAELDLAREDQVRIMQQANQLTTHLAELRTQINHSEQALEDDYDTSFEYAKSQMSALSLQEIRTQLKLIRRGLYDLGPVNVHAIEEYAEVKERYDFLHQQKTDLETAQVNLMTTMSEMDHEVEQRFKATFDAVAEHFSEIFVKMFGGGQAQLLLTDPEHLLTTGVDIKAQPPGKKFQQMSLLSGGEKALTAISLLFAILEVRPVPFAVLDETEAALDEANVDRFARYLHEVNERTQFIVITHRKGTMTHADVLYGVTMQEPGISTMVSVSLTDDLIEA